MAISSPGLGSGLNITSIVSQLVAVESLPVQLLQKKSSVLQTKLSVFGQIKSELSALKEAASALTDLPTWNSKSFTSSNAAVTGTSTSEAAVGSFSVEVQNLVTTQSATVEVPTGYQSTGTYTLNIQLGTRVSKTAQSTQLAKDDLFTPGSVKAEPITVKKGDTLADIAASINADSNSGVVATVITTTAGTQKLALRGSAAGANAGFQISSTGVTSTNPDGLLQEMLITDPTDATKQISQTPKVFANVGAWATTQYAADAKATIDGIAVTSSTNTITGVVAGVTLNLLSPTTSSASISVDTDKAGIKTKIQAFQDAYNKLYSDLKTQTAYDAASKTGGPLLGDNTANSMMSMLRNVVGANGPASGNSLLRLSDLGMQIQSDGLLKTNASTLDAAMQTPGNVKALFSGSSDSTGGYGIARRMYDFAFGALGVGGSVSTHSTAFQKSIDRNTADIDKFNSHIAAYQKQLLAQYTALDTNMAKLNSLSTYVSQQLAQWNKTS